MEDRQALVAGLAVFLVRPAQRITSRQGNVDWFDFWLNNREDASASKAAQYERWRELRRMQNKNIGR